MHAVYSYYNNSCGGFGVVNGFGSQLYANNTYQD